MATQDNQNNAGNPADQSSAQGKLTEKEKEMASEQKGGQGSKGGPDQHGTHGSQATNPNGKLPSGKDGHGYDGNDER